MKVRRSQSWSSGVGEEMRLRDIQGAKWSGLAAWGLWEGRRVSGSHSKRGLGGRRLGDILLESADSSSQEKQP